jgi:hypothetical protein
MTKTQIKAGDVLHCSSSGWLGRKIQKFTKSEINHTAFAIDIWGELFIIDSQKDGTNPRKFDDWQKKYNYSYIIHRNINPEFDVKYYSKRAMSKSGKTPYDFFALFIHQPVFIWTGIWLGRNRKKAEKRMYCSEFVAWVLKIRKWWTYNPKDVYEELSKDLEWVEIEQEIS